MTFLWLSCLVELIFNLKQFSMRKITLLCIALLCFSFTWEANAQFSESFEVSIPATWTVINGGGANGWVRLDNPTGGAQDGTAVASLTYNNTAHNDHLITPPILVTAGLNDQLSYFIKSRASTFLEPYEVLLSTTDATAASFNVVLQASSEAPNAWTPLSFNLSAYVGQTVYVSIHATGTDEFQLFVDNVVSNALPSCPNPINVIASAITTTSVNIGWDAGGTETAWEYALLTSPSSAPATGTSIGTNSYTGTLTPSTAYDFYVRAVCGGDFSTWKKISFTSADITPECATAPVFPADGAVDVTRGPITFTWTAPTTGVTPTSYNLYVVDNSAGDNPTLVGNFLTPSAALVINVFGTQIFWQVVSVNGVTEATGCEVWSFTTETAPVGAICETAIVIGALPYNTTDNTSNYFDDYNGVPGTSCGATNGYLNGDDVVYAYTATNTGSINISMTPTATYSGIFVYTSCADIGISCAAGVGNSGTAVRTFDLSVVNGTTYYIVISTWATPQSTAYTLNITENTCTNATVTYAVVGDCEVGGSNGFFVDITVSNLGTATALTISNNQNAIEINVTATGTYQFGPFVNATDVIISVADDNDASCSQNSVALTQIACPPVNDDACDAIAVAMGSVSSGSAYSNINASVQTGEVGGTCWFFSNPASHSVWFSFVAPDSGEVRVSTVYPGGTLSDSQLTVYSATDCNDLSTFVEVGCDEDDDGDVIEGGSAIAAAADVLGLTPGVTYYVQIDGYSSGTGTFDLGIFDLSALSIVDVESKDTFTYFPNPVNNILNLKAQSSIQNVAIYNMLGQRVQELAPKSLNSEVDMSSLQTGAYFVKVTINDVIETIRVIKQ